MAREHPRAGSDSWAKPGAGAGRDTQRTSHLFIASATRHTGNFDEPRPCRWYDGAEGFIVRIRAGRGRHSERVPGQRGRERDAERRIGAPRTDDGALRPIAIHVREPQMRSEAVCLWRDLDAYVNGLERRVDPDRLHRMPAHLLPDLGFARAPRGRRVVDRRPSIPARHEHPRHTE